MAEEGWGVVFRQWLRARFAAELDEAGIERAAESAELMRRIAEPVGRVRLDNGEMPFSNLLPPPREGD